MPLARAVPRALVALLTLMALAACASSRLQDAQPLAAESATARMPREVQIGAVNMVIQRVEADVSREEVAAAIAPMIGNATVCMRWPALWIEEPRRTSFVVRYDLMARDWGDAAVASAEARMSEFEEMGFVVRQAGADPGIVGYSLTDRGVANFSGAIEPGRRPNFCAPAERRLVEITALEWGQFPCGTLLVRFTHDGEQWPSWANPEPTRARLAAASWPAGGAAIEGSVSLSRQWFRRQDLPPGVVNGALRSACYDSRRQQIVGDDLSLSLGAID